VHHVPGNHFIISPLLVIRQLGQPCLLSRSCLPVPQWNVSMNSLYGVPGDVLEAAKDAQFFWDENHPWDRTGHRSAPVLGSCCEAGRKAWMAWHSRVTMLRMAVGRDKHACQASVLPTCARDGAQSPEAVIPLADRDLDTLLKPGLRAGR
jgi:hypothetical protein